VIKNIILCADDYAQSPAISQGIINLIAQKRLSATSCMVNSSYWPEHAAWLKPYIEQVDIGLHFNLTYGAPLDEMPYMARSGYLPSVNRLLIESHLGMLSYNEIYAELTRQLTAFNKGLGKMPDFIDGHQHIHCFPIIRQVLLDYYDKNLRGTRTWLRNICPAKTGQLLQPPATHKKIILFAIGGKFFKNKIIKTNIPHNNSFSGIYKFNTINSYGDLFIVFLKSIEHGGLIMCHPGLSNNDLSDPITKSRAIEYEYLSSDRFLVDMQQYDFALARYKFQ
jgi:predicted glycoside hydrolase/deacetylase ChbG (UPF0249 family)